MAAEALPAEAARSAAPAWPRTQGTALLSARSVQVVDHYDNPRNVGSMDKSDPSVGTGLVGAPACGDVMKLQIKVWPFRALSVSLRRCLAAISSYALATCMYGRRLVGAESHQTALLCVMAVCLIAWIAC